MKEEEFKKLLAESYEAGYRLEAKRQQEMQELHTAHNKSRRLWGGMLHLVGFLVGIGGAIDQPKVPPIQASLIPAAITAVAMGWCLGSVKCGAINFANVASALYITKSLAPYLASTLLTTAENIDVAGVVIVIGASFVLSSYYTMQRHNDRGVTV